MDAYEKYIRDKKKNERRAEFKEIFWMHVRLMWFIVFIILFIIFVGPHLP